MHYLNKLLILFTCFLVFACTSKQPEIVFGTDDCDYCKMKIMDNKYGLLLVTEKGRTYKFDDFHCFDTYLKEQKPVIKNTWVVTFDEPGKLMEAQSSFFVEGPAIKSPMGSGVAFFKDAGVAKTTFRELEREGKFEEILK